MNTTNVNKQMKFYLPGMFTFLEERGLYPAISVTGRSCQLNCAHCQGKLLKDMIPAMTPDVLVETCIELEKKGNLGCLISGGSDLNGQLPWQTFYRAIKEIKEKTSLKISVHTGVVDEETANLLKEADVDQVLIDIIGSDETLRKVYNLHFGTNRIYDSLRYLYNANLSVVPHVVIGIHYGMIKGENHALLMLRDFRVTNLVLVILNPLHGTEMQNVRPVAPKEFATVLHTAQIQLPDASISLGCARPRDKTCFLYEKVAIDMGVEKVAFPSEQAIAYAKDLNMEVMYEKTCCSW